MLLIGIPCKLSQQAKRYINKSLMGNLFINGNGVEKKITQGLSLPIPCEIIKNYLFQF